MLEKYYRAEVFLSRLRNGPMGLYLPGLVRLLEEQGFKRGVIRQSVRTAEALGQWLRKQGVPLVEANRSHVDAFVRQRFGTRHSRRMISCVPRIVQFLQGHGVLNAPEIATGADRWLQRFDEHLAHVHGFCPAVRENYGRYAHRFLASRPDGTVPDWPGLKANDIQSFVQSEMAKLNTTPSRRHPATAMRAVIRFLVSEGSVSPDLIRSIPVIRDWKHATLPKHFSAEELERVLAVCSGDAELSFRDRAMVLLMARLGMRAGEVRQLQLEDIDWAAGVIRVHLGKSRYERNLPLPEDAGIAIISYLREERPPSPDRTIFLRARAPHIALSSVVDISRRVLKRAEITGIRVGAHHFRHTAATQMVRQGASFKDVADILGHRYLETTAIYAKLDVHCLAQVALPWPGGAQ